MVHRGELTSLGGSYSSIKQGFSHRLGYFLVVGKYYGLVRDREILGLDGLDEAVGGVRSGLDRMDGVSADGELRHIVDVLAYGHEFAHS